MIDAIYHIFVIALAAVALVRGYRNGLSGQAASVMGMAFGIVCAHVFIEPVRAWVWETWPSLASRFAGDILADMLAASAVYVAVFALFLPLGKVMRSAFSLFSSGVLDSIFGAAFCMFKYLFFISMAFNLLVDVNPYSSLVKYAEDHDGNVVEETMKIAPAAFTVPGVDELAHRRRLEEAKLISCNFSAVRDVYNKERCAPAIRSEKIYSYYS